ncbi:hypothetical protein CsatB_003397 [Cannabis sativa]
MPLSFSQIRKPASPFLSLISIGATAPLLRQPTTKPSSSFSQSKPASPSSVLEAPISPLSSTSSCPEQSPNLGLFSAQHHTKLLLR